MRLINIINYYRARMPTVYRVVVIVVRLTSMVAAVTGNGRSREACASLSTFRIDSAMHTQSIYLAAESLMQNNVYALRKPKTVPLPLSITIVHAKILHWIKTYRKKR